MTAELVGHLIDTLLQLGANDAWTQSIGMKKSRPGVQLNVLCSIAAKNDMLATVFRESSSIGVRISTVRRASLRRSMVQIQTPYGPCAAKVSYLGDDITTVKAEYEDMKALAAKHQVPLKVVALAASHAVSEWQKSQER
jgi:pyridinium-3,5-bisthiocarboxylic acid mononucleotide nickel chelatase